MNQQREKAWTFTVGDRYAEIWDGVSSGVTLLRIGGQHGEPGRLDVARVREFAAAIGTEKKRVEELENLLHAARDQCGMSWSDGDDPDDVAGRIDAYFAQKVEADK